MKRTRFLLLAAWLILGCQFSLAQLRVHFFDVGQGDGVLIQSPSGENLVYDGGRSNAGMLTELSSLGISRVDLVIASHNHADHIAGLAGVLERFRPRFYMDNGIPATTFTYQNVLEAVRASGTQLLEPTARRISLGEVVLQVLPPPGAGEQNQNSVGLIVEYGEFRLSLAGDADPREWAWWLQTHPSLLKRVQVHKASHHGSQNGDIPASIARLMPETVVISVGGSNSYGHPDPSTLALYRNAKVYRTDIAGTIVIEAERSGTYTVRTGQEGVPRPPPEVLAPIRTSLSVPAASPSCIDINTASARALETIIHIGEVRAREIVTLRRSQPFKSVQELVQVNGIAAARVRDILAEGRACVR